MSIHQSKGLEFPVVILADLHKRASTGRTTEPAGAGASGAGAWARIGCDLETPHPATPPSPRTALALRLEREAKAEEMRILYVAMTRAKEKLILVASTAARGWRRSCGNLTALTGCTGAAGGGGRCRLAWGVGAAVAAAHDGRQRRSTVWQACGRRC